MIKRINKWKNYFFNLSLCSFTQILIRSPRGMGNSIMHPKSTQLAYFWWTPLHEKEEIHEKMWCWCQHHIFSCISCFSWSGVHQTYAKWVLFGCKIEFQIQRVLHIKIWVTPHEDKLKIWVEKLIYFFFSSKIWWGKLILFYYFHYYFIISLRRPILDLKIPLMESIQASHPHIWACL